MHWYVSVPSQCHHQVRLPEFLGYISYKPNVYQVTYSADDQHLHLASHQSLVLWLRDLNSKLAFLTELRLQSLSLFRHNPHELDIG